MLFYLATQTKQEITTAKITRVVWPLFGATGIAVIRRY
jgi:hypothetical protein